MVQTDTQPDDLDRARGGDRAALGRLLQAHERRLFNVCLRMVNQADDAAELTQDTLVKIVQSIEGFRGDSRFSTWATRIAMNLAISHLRKRKLRRTDSLDRPFPGNAALRMADTLAQAREPDAPSRVEQNDELRRLYAAIARLEDDQRAVLVLRDIDQMDYQELALALDIPVGTVKSRLFRARLALREQLAPAPAPAPTPAT